MKIKPKIALIFSVFSLLIISCEDKTDSNSAPSDITLSANTVKENQPALTTVGSFSVTDQDTDDKHTFELTNDSEGSFVIIGSALKTGKPLDFESAQEHEITVLVSDSDDSSFSKSFKVTVTDEGEIFVNKISGNISANTTWKKDDQNILVGQTFVQSGVTLTIEAGTTIYSESDDGNGLAPALIVEQGGKLIAKGTASQPITFTSTLDMDADGQALLPLRGTWGGLIILGRAPISVTGGVANVEGVEGKPYGGNDPEDNSGVLEYVRVWYGGRSIGQDNEINGITLAGVGRGTVVKYCEVAYNLDDGFEMFGGTVDLKYCSVIGVGDDAYDVDQGYQGRGQFLFAKVLKDDGNRAYEMDNKTNGNLDSSPRSHPVFYNATLVGPGGDAVSNNDQMARLREGLGGEFGNHIVYNGKEYGVRNSDNGSETVTQDLASVSSLYPDYLFWSENNVVHKMGTALFKGFASDFKAKDVDTGISIDSYLPKSGGSAFEDVDTVPSDGFFEQVNFKGAFGSNDWLSSWSILNK